MCRLGFSWSYHSFVQQRQFLYNMLYGLFFRYESNLSKYFEFEILWYFLSAAVPVQCMHKYKAPMHWFMHHIFMKILYFCVTFIGHPKIHSRLHLLCVAIAIHLHSLCVKSQSWRMLAFTLR